MSTMRPLLSAAAVCVVLACAGFLAAVEPPRPATIIAVGDIMLSRNVALRMRDAGDPLLPFRGVSALLSSSDLNFGNLESPLAPTDKASASPHPDGTASETWDGTIGGTSLVFAAPNASVRALSRYNFRMLAMANNHALDQGEDGLAHTLEQLSASNIQVAGAGGDLEEAWRPRIVELRGRKIGFLAASYASLNYGTDERNEYVARIEDLTRLRSEVSALKPRVDCVIVAMHAGTEYTAEPCPAQIQFAHAAVDAGANIVVGSHPHWIQPFERYNGGLIFYSLGNFIFDLDGSKATREGVAVKFSIGGAGVISAQVYPVEIENSCCPRPARPDEVPAALRRMRLGSRRILLDSNSPRHN
jgi:poly-gamma-glutamate synthesis protein (capsule biosynthesis protein)